MATPDKLQSDLLYLRKVEAFTLRNCRKSGVVDGYVWNAKGRAPPLPFHSFVHEDGKCRVCGQPTGGRRRWHEECVTTYTLWTKPAQFAHVIVFRQAGVCEITGEPVGMPARAYLTSVDIDHRVPIFRVRAEMANRPWFRLLRYWGLANLRAITLEAHKAKNREEARSRAKRRVEGEISPGHIAAQDQLSLE